MNKVIRVWRHLLNNLVIVQLKMLIFSRYILRDTCWYWIVQVGTSLQLRTPQQTHQTKLFAWTIFRLVLEIDLKLHQNPLCLRRQQSFRWLPCRAPILEQSPPLIPWSWCRRMLCPKITHHDHSDKGTNASRFKSKGIHQVVAVSSIRRHLSWSSSISRLCSTHVYEPCSIDLPNVCLLLYHCLSIKHLWP